MDKGETLLDKDNRQGYTGRVFSKWLPIITIRV